MLIGTECTRVSKRAVRNILAGILETLFDAQAALAKKDGETDRMAYSAVEIERKHPTWKYVFSVYDEIVFEVPEQEADEASAETPRIMTKGDYIKDWTEGLALEVEGDVCDRYHK